MTGPPFEGSSSGPVALIAPQSTPCHKGIQLSNLKGSRRHERAFHHKRGSDEQKRSPRIDLVIAKSITQITKFCIKCGAIGGGYRDGVCGWRWGVGRGGGGH